MKKKHILPIALALLVIFGACNRKDFVNKLSGTWKISHYIFAKQDQTATFSDTSNVGYMLTINEDQTYSEIWKTFKYFPDSTILVDSTRMVDTTTHDTTYTITRDTLRFTDSTITPYTGRGHWDLLNSEQDLQLKDNSDSTNVRQFQILKLNKSNLNLLNGNQEFDLVH